jgi:hypothetical protein
MSFEDERRGVVDYGMRMAALATTFPGLAQADGVFPWEAEHFERWLRSGAPGHGAKYAGQFVLSVWNPYTEWKSGRFDLHEALGIWDNPHRAAFVAWVRSPWWP